MTYPATPHYFSLILASMMAPITNAQTQNTTTGATVAEGRMVYIGDTAQISLGLSQNARWYGELNGVLHESSNATWLGEGWTSQGEGGLKFSHHQLTAPDNVRKLFIAVDQNRTRDKKITLGYGTEKEHWFGQINFSQAITQKRLIADHENSSQTQQIGEAEGRHFQDTTTQTIRTIVFEKAYDHGIGLRFGRYLEDQSLRLSAGWDYEWGQNKAHQNTASLMAEKMFPGTPHSIALQLSHAHKVGPFEPTRHDARGLLIYRYSLGRTNAQPERLYQVKSIQPTGTLDSSVTTTIAPKTASTRLEKQWIKTKAIMNADAFFEFDSAKLTPQALIELERIALVLQTQGREGPMLITGHTCDIGSHRVNDKLSLARAQAVKNHLITLGVLTEENAQVEGLGKRAQKYPATEATRAQNRRVELEFFSFIDQEKLIPIAIEDPTPTAPLPAKTANVTYEREPIVQPPAWIQRALRNPGQHNRIVSVYRIQEETQTQSTQRQWINQAPVAQNDTYSVVAGSTATFSILDNDLDPDPNDTISLVSVSAPMYGQASLVGRQIVYRAQANQVGKDTFSYTIKDAQGLTATAQVSVTLTQPNRAPQANDDRIGVSGYIPSPLVVTSNDTDPDGDPITLTSITQPIANSGRVEITPNGLLFTPNGPFMVDWFSYTITDGKGGSSSATVQLVDP